MQMVTHNGIVKVQHTGLKLKILQVVTNIKD